MFFNFQVQSLFVFDELMLRYLSKIQLQFGEQVLLMEKKIEEISDAFQHLRFAECLSIIDHTLKKISKNDKKKPQPVITDIEMKIIKCFKAGSLVSLGQYHEGHVVFEELLDAKSIQILGKDQIFLLLAIAELFGQNREKELLELLDKYAPNHAKNKIYRFCLSSRQFAGLGKLFLKDFLTTKNMSLQLGQVYLEYLQHTDKCQMIQYSRDGWYKYNQKIKDNLKMTSMFLDKCIKSSWEHKQKLQKQSKQKENTLKQQEKQQPQKKIKNSKKLIDRANELKLKIAINEGKALEAIKLFEQISLQLKFPFTFIRSILKLKEVSEYKEQIERFYLGQMSRIFRKNLNFSQYSPWYDYYNQFLQYILSQAEKTNPNFRLQVKIEAKKIQSQKLYIFESLNFSEAVTVYNDSLYSQYSKLTDETDPDYQVNKKSDYYKICIKGLILQLIQISKYFNNKELLIKYLRDYTKIFSSTLTYTNEIKGHRKLIINEQILVKPLQVTDDNKLIQEVNYHKIKIAVETQVANRQGFDIVLKELGQLYQIRVKQIQKNRKLQKGQRYLSDQFYTIIADYARAYIEQESDQSLIIKTANIMINELQYVVEVSPFNADTKLRLMYFCSLLNHYQRLIQVYLSNDIKSVQMQTLGYLFLRPAIQFNQWNTYDSFTDKFVKSYQENQRQTSQYGLKALIGGQLDRVDEYLTYRTCISNSYNSVVLFYLLYHKYRFQNNSEYYLVKINDKINSFKANQRKLTLNADFKVLNNQLFEDLHFAEFYGLFNSYQILQYETNLYLHESFIVNGLLERKTQTTGVNLIDISKLQELIHSFESQKLFDFSSFTFQQQPAIFNLQKSKNTLLRNSNYLQNFKNISQLRINAIILVSELQATFKSQQIKAQTINSLVNKLLESLKQLQGFFSKIDYRSQIHAISIIRRGLFESYNILNVARQVVAKNKKLKFAKELVEKSTFSCIESIFSSIVEIRWSQNKEESVSKLVIKRDQILERQLSIDQKQAKRILSKYQNIYKC